MNRYLLHQHKLNIPPEIFRVGDRVLYVPRNRPGTITGIPEKPYRYDGTQWDYFIEWGGKQTGGAPAKALKRL